MFGLIAGCYSLLPKLTVMPSDRLDPDDPFSTIFLVSNDGVLPVHSVEFSCVGDYVKYPNDIELFRNTSIEYTPIRETIDAGDKVPVPCPAAGIIAASKDEPVRKAGITLKVMYRPDWWWSSHEKKEFHFIGLIDRNDTVHWVQDTAPLKSPYSKEDKDAGTNRPGGSQ